MTVKGISRRREHQQGKSEGGGLMPARPSPEHQQGEAKPCAAAETAGAALAALAVAAPATLVAAAPATLAAVAPATLVAAAPAAAAALAADSALAVLDGGAGCQGIERGELPPSFSHPALSERIIRPRPGAGDIVGDAGASFRADVGVGLHVAPWNGIPRNMAIARVIEGDGRCEDCRIFATYLMFRPRRRGESEG